MTQWLYAGLGGVVVFLLLVLIAILISRIEANRALDRKIKDLESQEGRDTDPLRRLLADPLAHERLSSSRKAEIEKELEEAQRLFYESDERRTSADD